jgi:oligopeptide/dipeptide ABC transporter ATP-binding protein
MDNSLITTEKLVKNFYIKGTKKPLVAVNDVSICVPKGKTLGLVGESGSGKSTLGRCLIRLLEPTRGKVIFDSQNIAEINKKDFRKIWRSRMQIVFQYPFDSLNPRMSVKETIAEPLLLHNLLIGNGKSQVAELMNRVQLDPTLMDTFRHQLTGGQQQRVGIARAIATKPDFIVLDEPVSLLDVSVRSEILQLLAKIQEELNVTYLFISHDLSTVKYICHHVAVMYLGRVVETGTTNQVFNNPLHPYSRALLSSVLKPDPMQPHSLFELAGEIPSPLEQPDGCALHTRCPIAQEECKVTPQHLFDVVGGHKVACMRIENKTYTW